MRLGGRSEARGRCADASRDAFVFWNEFYTFCGYQKSASQDHPFLYSRSPMPAPDHVPSPELAALIELAAHPDALRWARECGWIPGTGHCRNRGCADECLFRPQREAEARRVIRDRRQRRKRQDPAAAEGCSSPPGAADRGARGTG